MDENNKNPSYDLDEIIAEFRSAPPAAKQPPPESLADRSKRLVMKTMDDAFSADGAELLSGLIDETAEAAPPASVLPPAPSPAERAPQGTVLARPDLSAPPPAAARAAELEVRELADADEAAEYASQTAADNAEEDEREQETPANGRGKTKAEKESFLSPLVALMALIALRREERAKNTDARPAVPPDEPEPPPGKAAKSYAARMGSLRLRGRIAAALSAVMLYLSFAYHSAALPLTGALGEGVRVLSLLLLIFEISVVMTGLDVFTAGLLGIAGRRPGAESLISVSCVLSMLDAAVIAAMNKPDYGLPFCAVSAISMTFAIWGAYYTCKGRRTCFRVLASSKTRYTVSAERGLAKGDLALLKSERNAAGFIRRSEAPGPDAETYGTLAPFLLAAAAVLGLLASLARGRAGAGLHCVSVLAAAAAPFSCAICFSVPFSAAARRLYQSGASIAGWTGLRDVGKSRYVVITDGDVFPRGTVEIGKIRILEGAFTDQVISCTGSVIAASGSGLAGPFAELIRRNGYSFGRVEHFEPHDGGGMTAMVGGESVYVGGAGFMNLMGIRLPQRLNTKNSLFTAINGTLVGIFNVEYKPTGSVQDALVLLLHSKLEPIFAIRDFNITPSMIKTKFKMPTDSFKFPAYAERYRISAAEPGPDSRIAAVIVRDGMGPLVEVAERGRRAYLGVRVATIISALGSVFGLLVMFLLCWTGAFDSAAASNVIIFMLLWLIPIALALLNMER